VKKFFYRGKIMQIRRKITKKNVEVLQRDLFLAFIAGIILHRDWRIDAFNIGLFRFNSRDRDGYGAMQISFIEDPDSNCCSFPRIGISTCFRGKNRATLR
jgi:hypothetical protein